MNMYDEVASEREIGDEPRQKQTKQQQEYIIATADGEMSETGIHRQNNSERRHSNIWGSCKSNGLQDDCSCPATASGCL